MMNEHGKSDRPVVPAKSPNKAGQPAAEGASRENAAAGVRTVRGRKPEEARRRETGDVQLPRLYAHLREEEEQWTLHGVATDDSQTVASEAERGQDRAQAAHA